MVTETVGNLGMAKRNLENRDGRVPAHRHLWSL